MVGRHERIQVLRLSDVALVHDPIDPDWVIEGSPVARSTGWARSRDGSASSWVWDCTAGRFHWYFPEDETVHVVEGAVTVSADGVDPVTLGVGDAALFRGGTWAVWEVADHVTKHAVVRADLPWLLAVVAAAWRRLARPPRRRRAPSLG